MNPDCKRERAIDLVKKLLALSSSPNEHEAANAMAKAQLILTKYNLEINDIPGIDPSTIEMSREFVDGSKAMWQLHLCNALCVYNYCTSIRHVIWKMIDGKEERCIQYAILGRKMNVAVVSELYHWVLPQLHRLAEKAISEYGGSVHGKTFRNSFLEGCIAGIKERLKAQYEANLNELPKTRALIVCYDGENEDYQNSLYKKTYKIYPNSSFNSSAYYQGKDASKNVSLSLREQVSEKKSLAWR